MAGHVRGRRTTAGVVAVCAAVLGMGLAACTPEEEPTPVETTYRVTEEPATETVTPTPTVTETPTLTPEEVNIEAAKQTVVEYYAAVDEVARGGFGQWAQTLAPFWGTADVANYYGQLFQQAASEGLRAEGQTAISDVIADSPSTEPTTDAASVEIEFCEDTSGITLYTPDGTPVPKAPDARAVWRAVLEQQANSSWAFSELAVNGDRAC